MQRPNIDDSTTFAGQTSIGLANAGDVGYDCPAMGPVIDRFDALSRGREKELSRVADDRDLASGRKSPQQLRRENEVFAWLSCSARVDLAASRSLG